MTTHDPATHPRRTARITLAALATLVIAAAAAFALLYEPPPPPLPPLVVTWTPTEPTQGHLFLIRVAAPPDSGAVSATGEAGGETLHFHATDSTLESFAPVPINATDSIDAWVQATYPTAAPRPTHSASRSSKAPTSTSASPSRPASARPPTKRTRPAWHATAKKPPGCPATPAPPRASGRPRWSCLAPTA